MKPKKPSLCAGGCQTVMARADGHAVGWRPLCKTCVKAGKSTDFNEARFAEDGSTAVREPCFVPKV